MASAASPVVVSRIQNRRGTQSQFDNLYPYLYSGIGGYGSQINPASITAIAGDGAVVTVSVSDSVYYPPGSSVVVAGVTPAGYTGTFVVTSSSPGTFTYNSTTTGAASVLGTTYSAYNLTLYPNVLMPGELALCTDSRRMFMGNLNGEYLEVEQVSANTAVQPLSLLLPPQVSYTVIPELTYTATPFMNISYSVSNSGSTDWNAVGATFSRNGEMKVTAINSAQPSPVNLVDSSVEVNNVVGASLSFQAQYSGGSIQIRYTHNFPTSLRFATSVINWVPFS